MCLQVSMGAHETVKKVANDMTQLKQDLANIQGTRLHMRQQTGMLAELRSVHVFCPGLTKALGSLCTPPSKFGPVP